MPSLTPSDESLEFLPGAAVPALVSGPAVPMRVTPFDVNFVQQRLPGPLDSYSFVEFSSDAKLHDLLLGYIFSHPIGGQNASSLRMGVREIKPTMLERMQGKKESEKTSASLGLGWHRFVPEGDDPCTFFALCQEIGKPVGTSCGIGVHSNLVIFTPLGRECEIKRLCDELLLNDEDITPETFKIFRWHIKYQYWKRECIATARPIDSVFLPAETKQRLLRDADDFLSEDSMQFYVRHGIPYKRSYLFYGVPGAGKTSLIQALAGRLGRNVCFLQPTHPEMTDDSLRKAICDVPQRSIVVLEDIDALFDKQRTRGPTTDSGNRSCITFSGLLNSLDGLGDPTGQIFVMTTNFRDRLDSALIRNGRVDLHIEFTYAVREQGMAMFESFYPASGLGGDFWDALVKALCGRQVTTAALQHFFITQRQRSAAQALANVDEIVRDLEEKDSERGNRKGGERTARTKTKKTTKGVNAIPRRQETQFQAMHPAPVHIYVHSGFQCGPASNDPAVPVHKPSRNGFPSDGDDFYSEYDEESGEE
jgi:chaperone BCS1